MDRIDLDELERLAQAATPGPWVTEGLYSVSHYDEAHEWHGIVIQADICGKMIPSEKDAAYIVAACNAVPELIARVRELERQREFFLKALKENSLCPARGCFDGSEFDEWDCTAANNRECWIKAADEGGG